MEWFYYLLEANLYLLVFFGFYKFLLDRTTFYNANRYYLIASVCLAFFLPLIQIGFLKSSILQYDVPISITRIEKSRFGPEDYLLFTYLIICGCLLARFAIKLSKIYFLWEKGRKKKYGSYTIVELNDQHTVFSFFNILFIHPSLINKQTIIEHELVHISQKHSTDLVLMEFLLAVSWFNPINYLIKKDLKLLHEYIADQSTTEKGVTKHAYALLLIENSLIDFSTPLTNQFFNQSILKKRINMLNKKKTAKWARLNFALVVPLVGGMLCLSTLGFSKDYGYFDIMPKSLMQQDTAKKARKPLPPPPPTQDRIKFPPPIVKPAKNSKIVTPPPPKQDQVKFPPPLVRPAKSSKTVTPPPPKEDQVKFPPPIVRPAKSSKTVTPPPPKQDQVKFPPPIVRPNKNSKKNTNLNPKPNSKRNNDIDNLSGEINNAILKNLSLASAKTSNNVTNNLTGAKSLTLKGNLNHANPGATTIYKIDSLQKKNK